MCVQLCKKIRLTKNFRTQRLETMFNCSMHLGYRCSIYSRASPRSFDGGGDEFIGSRHPNSLTPKIKFLLGFRPLSFENIGKMQNKNTFEEKKYCNIQISGGRLPLLSKVRGSFLPPPRLPAGDVPAYSCKSLS